MTTSTSAASAPTNRIKRLILQGHPQFGLFCCSHSIQTVEALLPSGFDFLLFDLEHTPNDYPSLHAQLATLASSHTAAVVRVPEASLPAFKMYLDLGVHAIMVANVASAEQARAAVSYTRYPPQGVRGVAGSVRVLRYGRDRAYFATANDNVCVMAQIESREGLRNLEAIAAVDGIDLLFFGPSDLAADCGHLGQPSHPDVIAMVEDGIRRVRALGKHAGVLAGEPDLARYLEAGCTVAAIGSDLGLMVRAADQAAAKYVKAPAQ